MPPPVSRVEAVQALRALAAKYGVDRVPDRASRARVGTMVDELLAVETLSVEDKAQVEEAVAQHAASYGDRVPAAAPPPEAHQADEEDASPKLWKLRAAQVTYNSTEGEWASASIAVLLGLFERLKAFACHLVSFLKAMGISATLERSMVSGHHVHRESMQSNRLTFLRPIRRRAHRTSSTPCHHCVTSSSHSRCQFIRITFRCLKTIEFLPTRVGASIVSVHGDLSNHLGQI
jgi:hypothetical protein